MKEIDNNIQESYVSYEVGKLLKNKGFNWIYDEFNPDYNGEHSYFQNINTNEIKMLSHYYFDNNHNGIQWMDLNIPAPTHALAIEWLRVNFGVWVIVNFANKNKWYFDCNRIGFSGEKKRIYSSDYDYSSPQEATEVALKYVLEELI